MRFGIWDVVIIAFILAVLATASPYRGELWGGITMLIEALAVGTFWFWALVVGVNVGLLAWIENECGGWATWGVIATLAAFQFLGDVPVFGWVVANPHVVLAGAGAYLLVGVLWATARWWFHVKKARRLYDELRAGFVAKHGLDPAAPIPDHLKQEFWNAVRYGDDKVELKPKVADHKERIYLWLGFWPWSMTWTLINDPVMRAIRWAYDSIKATLQRISDRVWKGTDQDLPGE
jgi:hypothetical protein